MEKFMKEENSTKAFLKMKKLLEVPLLVQPHRKWFSMKWKFCHHYQILGNFSDLTQTWPRPDPVPPNTTFLGFKNWLILSVNHLTWFLFWNVLLFIRTIQPHLTSVVCSTLFKAKMNEKIFFDFEKLAKPKTEPDWGK